MSYINLCRFGFYSCGALAVCASFITTAGGQDLQPLKYNHPGLVVDLGVGLWAFPLPMDFDGDGDNDLVVSCPDRPSNGTYFFENAAGDVAMPVFKPAVRIGAGHQFLRVSYVAGQPRVLAPGREFADFTNQRLDDPVKLPLPTNVHTPGRKIRQNSWHYVDYDDDGALDIVIGIDDWADYGWDDAFDARGNWTRGPLRGYVYLARNTGTTAKPKYAAPTKIEAGDKPLETFGWPSPCFADFDRDGDLDIICGEFLDKFTWFENTGSRKSPVYAAGRRLQHAGKPLAMDLEMIVPTAIDWDKDGDVDLIVGDEDGRVAFVENTGKIVASQPAFLPPKYFQQQADRVKCGALATPVAFDWDGDGDQDILAGNTAGYVQFYENLGPSGEAKTSLPQWAAPVRLKADGETIRIEAGPNGSIQGPCEAKWGYTTLSVADWNADGLADIVLNSIWGKVLWYENIGTRTAPKLAQARPIEVDWPAAPPKPAWTWWQPEGTQLVTQWRTTPVVVDFDRDGLNDLVMLDHEGYLALFRRSRDEAGQLHLAPGERIFVDEQGKPLRFNAKTAGGSGRRKLHAADWDGDSRSDLLANGTNADFWRNVATRDGKTVLVNQGPLAKTRLDAHDTSPCVVDFNGDGQLDLLVGAEDGYLYYLERPAGK
jgi:hypothetical protein